MRITIRIPDELHSDITALAKESGASLNYIVEQALKYYRDKRYMDDKATFVSEEMLNIIQANNALLEQQINNKANRVLSELAIQNAIQNMILANELEVNDLDADSYRKKAIEFLKTNNRVFRLDELLK
ncbi:MAG: ribbon-helix-helix protein, CopG family [Eubacterium sp.]|nr:ribbon-helix-helix protein, CopG family [Eubacterium sp.]